MENVPPLPINVETGKVCTYTAVVCSYIVTLVPEDTGITSGGL